MTKTTTLIFLFLFILVGTGLRSDAQSSNRNRRVFAPEGEEFTVKNYASLSLDPSDSSTQGRQYSGIFGNVRLLIMSDRVTEKDGLYDRALGLAAERNAKGVSTVFNGLKVKKFAFKDDDGNRREFVALITKKRKYIFQTLSDLTSDPDSRRFFSSIRINTTRVNPPVKEKDYLTYGSPDSRYYVLSQGAGSGQGSGRGTGSGSGQGSGTGTGQGSGGGQGSGVGSGSGSGSGTGSGTCGSAAPVVAGQDTAVMNTGLKILSKPRANLTDAAKANNIQGTVTLRVTFLASGIIGPISPVTGLPYGLTEQAIAAARSIRFEPATKNGAPCTVVKAVQYTFLNY